MFRKDKLKQLETHLQLQVSWETSANSNGSNALTKTFYSPNRSFLEQKAKDLPAGWGFMNPPYSKLAQFVEHWTKCKAERPELKGVLVLPYRPQAPWFKHIAHLQVVQFYQKGSEIFSQPAARGTGRLPMAECPWPVMVLLDPPKRGNQTQNKQATKNAATTAAELAKRQVQMDKLLRPLLAVRKGPPREPPSCMFEYDCDLSGTAAHVAVVPTETLMLDSGCGVEHDGIIGSDRAKALGIRVKPLDNFEVTVGDGQAVKIWGEAEVHLRVQGMRTKVKCLVMDLLPQYDKILGQAWLTKHKVLLNYDTKVATVRINSTKVQLKPTKQKQANKPRTFAKELLTMAQTKRLARNGCRMWVVVVTPSLAAELGQKGTWVDRVLEDYADIIRNDIPPGSVIRAEVPEVIPTEHDRAVWRGHGNHSPKEREEMHTRVQYLLEQKMVDPSTSQYGAPVIFAEKPDGSLRMCINYKGLNSVTFRDRFPLPNMKDVVDKLQGSSWFTSMDVLNGFWQVQIGEKERHKTAFQTHEGSFEWRVLPMGLMNAPGTFQRIMNSVLKKYLGKICLVYIDDVIIFSKTEEEHKEHVRLVLDELRKHNVVLKKTKCKFGLREVKFLGWIVSETGVSSDPEKTKTLDDMQPPATLKQLQSFLGTVNWFSKYIPWFSSLVDPLHQLTQGGNKDIASKWKQEHQDVFNTVREEVKRHTHLNLPDPEKVYRVHTDASDTHLAMCLAQETGPLAFHSRRMTQAERKMGAYDREAIAIHDAYVHWREYLEGAKSICYTDHSPLVHLMKQTTLTRRQARILLYLQSL